MSHESPQLIENHFISRNFRQDVIFANGHDPFPSYFERFRIKEFDCCCYGEVAIHSITPPAAHSPLLFTSPNPPRISKQYGGIKLGKINYPGSKQGTL
ncbi:hypothetical protein AVEN_258245-1 [Araneus ventricosus]|uniref:Uncharacterized protein n=1 Tax=Araneus ventricosus TaxID=182803 RepID=A0A4Y2M6U6_ARAVE|nr:hypothetical protein AVEN_258245-1 [Araneus ventricosus]